MIHCILSFVPYQGVCILPIQRYMINFFLYGIWHAYSCTVQKYCGPFKKGNQKIRGSIKEAPNYSLHLVLYVLGWLPRHGTPHADEWEMVNVVVCDRLCTHTVIPGLWHIYILIWRSWQWFFASLGKESRSGPVGKECIVWCQN